MAKSKKTRNNNKLSVYDWNNIVNRYYEGEAPNKIAADLKIDIALVYDHINKDRSARARKGLPPRERKSEEYTIPAESSINTSLGELLDGVIIVEEESKGDKESAKMSKKKIEIPDNFIEIYQQYSNHENGITTMNAAAAKLNVSVSTFGRWVAEYKQSLEEQANMGNEPIKEFLEKKEEKQEVIEESISVEQSSAIIVSETEQLHQEETPTSIELPVLNTVEDRLATKVVFEERPVVEAGLVADRHDMPVSKYIFQQALDSALMWDYDSQDKIVERFLLKEVGIAKDPSTGNNVAKSDLVLYATGIQCCICSVFKMCEIYNVNLTVKHYNAARGTYKPQVVISGKGAGSGVEDVFKCNKLETLACNIDDIISSKAEYYTIKRLIYDKDGKCCSISEIICPYMNLVFDKYMSLLPDIMMHRDNKVRICINRARIYNGREQEIERVMDSKNKE